MPRPPKEKKRNFQLPVLRAGNCSAKRIEEKSPKTVSIRLDWGERRIAKANYNEREEELLGVETIEKNFEKDILISTEFWRGAVQGQ